MQCNYPDLFDEINEDNINRIIDAFMMPKGPIRVEEASPGKITFVNIETNLRTMAEVPTLKDRLKDHAETLKDQIKQSEFLTQDLDWKNRTHLNVLVSETRDRDVAQIEIDFIHKVLNDEI